jgi:hypothetical protein
MFAENQLDVVAEFQGYYLSTSYEACISMHGMVKGSIIYLCVYICCGNILFAF